jgi:anaerobic magnesium-protoporphyrin IX monomethyl ester cyclase
MPALGRRTLLINPPLVNGIAFTRQGRCQEREEVLGTTKPPYTLALLASLLRNAGFEVRLIDATAGRLTIEEVIARLDADDFAPTLILFPSTTPTLDADVAEMARLKRRYGAPMFCFGPHASTVPADSMARAPEVDGMLVGEPEDGVLHLAAVEIADGGAQGRDEGSTAGSPEGLRYMDVASLTWRRDGTIVPHRTHGTYSNFLEMPYPAWDLLDLEAYSLPLVDRSYVIVETSRGCPYTCDFCVAPIHQGHKFRERSAKALVDEIERGYRELGLEFFYLWGDTVTLNVKSFTAFCDELIARQLPIQWFGNARADNLTNPAFVHRLRRAGCWMLALGVESESDAVRKDMVKRLERQKIATAFKNMREAGIRSFAFFIFGYPGETTRTMEQTVEYAVDLDPDFANFYPAVPYPGTALYDKCARERLLGPDAGDWSKMEYSYYLLRGNGLDERVVMGAINRAKRRFFLRPRYVARHLGDAARLALTKQDIVWQVLRRTIFGARVVDASPPKASIGAAETERYAGTAR